MSKGMNNFTLPIQNLSEVMFYKIVKFEKLDV